MTRIKLLSLLLVLTFNYSFGQTLNFDEPFGTQSWSEDGHPWSWDNSGWDNIRTYQPHTGTGHGMSAPGYHSKLSTDANINILGIWLLTSFASDFTHLNLKGYNECGTLIYDVSLNPMDYQFSYAYVTLNWVGVKSFMVDYNSIDPLNSPVDLFYDDMDYSYIPTTNVLNFDEPFGTQSWSEDGHPWSWDNLGWDNIRTYQPHTGTGHGMSAPGYHSKLSTDVNINIQGIWLLTSFASDFTHLNLKGYNESGTLIYDVSLNPMDYESQYAYVTLNWVGVKSFMVDYNSIDPLNSPVDLFYDDMDYSYTSMRTGTDTRTECNSYTWIDGNNYTTSNNSATFNIVGGANGCDSLVTLDLTINSVSDLTTSISGVTISANNTGVTYQWLDCDNGYAIIPGETNQSYTASTNGNYAVELTENGCADTSACVAITTVGVLDNSFGEVLSIYPNPTTGIFSVDLGALFESSVVSITDISGRLIDSKTISQSQILNISIQEPSGIYIVSIQAGDKNAVIRLIKE